MAELNKKVIPLLRSLEDSVQATLFDEVPGTAPTESRIVHLDAGSIKEIPENLPPARLRIGGILVRLDRRIACHMNSETRGVTHRDPSENSRKKEEF